MKYNLDGVTYLVYYIKHYNNYSVGYNRRRFIKAYKTEGGMKRLIKGLLNVYK